MTNPANAPAKAQPKTLIDAPDDIVEFNDWAFARGWGDGLPLIPPTPERVERMLAGSDRAPDAVVAVLPPNEAPVTVRSIAVNAVMAGCRPEYMPVLVTAVEGLADPRQDFNMLQATTHPAATMMLINGPMAKHLNMHSGLGVFGPGFQSNATLGRGLRLVLMNVTGARPGDTDISTQGTPAKYSFCFAENEAESPWKPYHVDMGFAPEDSTVTVFGCEGPHNINDHTSRQPPGLMLTISHTMTSMGANPAYLPESHIFVVLGLEHAGILASHRWERSDVQQFLHDRVRIPYGIWKRGGMAYIPGARHLEAADDDYPVPFTGSADNYRVVVAGGLGRHSSWVPGFRNPSTTHLITNSDGTPWRP